MVCNKCFPFGTPAMFYLISKGINYCSALRLIHYSGLQTFTGIDGTTLFSCILLHLQCSKACLLTACICILNQVLILVLLDLPGLLFFSTYTLLVLFWAEIYHQASRVLLIIFLLRVLVFKICKALPSLW